MSSEYKAGTALSQTKYLILIQLLCSVGTYILNSWIARLVGPSIFGTAYVDFYIVYSASMFLSREYIRRACVNYHSRNKNMTVRNSERQIFTIGWWSLIVACIISYIIYYIFDFIHNTSDPTSSTSSTSSISTTDTETDKETYMHCILVCTIAGIVEMVAEPYVLIATMRVWSKLLAFFESLNLILRSVFAFIAMKWIEKKHSNDSELIIKRYQLEAFAYSQLLASIFIFWFWLLYFSSIILEQRYLKKWQQQYHASHGHDHDHSHHHEGCQCQDCVEDRRERERNTVDLNLSNSNNNGKNNKKNSKTKKGNGKNNKNNNSKNSRNCKNNKKNKNKKGKNKNNTSNKEETHDDNSNDGGVGVNEGQERHLGFEDGWMVACCDLFPRFTFSIEKDLLSMLYSFFSQSFVKFVLTEGEKLVMVSLHMDPTVSGVYSLVSNLGSLVARYVFRPIETSSYVEFSKLSKYTVAQKTETNNINNNNNDEEIALVGHILCILLKCVIFLSLMCIIFAPNYSFTVLDVIYGSKWSVDTNAPTVLWQYCFYILFMSVNGITEAYVMSNINQTKSNEEEKEQDENSKNKNETGKSKNNSKSGINSGIFSYNVWLVIFGVMYWGSCILIIGNNFGGASGIILAHCINMGCRIIYNIWFIYKNLKIKDIFTDKRTDKRIVGIKNGWDILKEGIQFDRYVFLMFFMAFIVGYLSKYQFISSSDYCLPSIVIEILVLQGTMLKYACYLVHVIVAVVLVACVAVVMWKFEHQFLDELYGLMTGKLKKNN